LKDGLAAQGGLRMQAFFIGRQKAHGQHSDLRLRNAA